MKVNFQKRSDDSALSFEGTVSLTRQEFVSSCNINNIIKKYVKNGNNPFSITADAKFGDFTDLPSSYQDALQLISAADDYFAQLPADVRSKFDNDPGKMLDFVNDKMNRDEAIKLGLVQEVINDDSKKIPAKPDVKDSEGVSKP